MQDYNILIIFFLIWCFIMLSWPLYITFLFCFIPKVRVFTLTLISLVTFFLFPSPQIYLNPLMTYFPFWLNFCGFDCFFYLLKKVRQTVSLQINNTPSKTTFILAVSRLRLQYFSAFLMYSPHNIPSHTFYAIMLLGTSICPTHISK